ncbi:hypothetical protein L9F63_016997 [Diploptera punctata]|uniref:NADH dehydrogenase (ubiquinone) complex I, assembly factor 6 n=1 Tax=Diploptera punctata TaxID=6984 RepID=A0AAD7ZZS2_DIPPU|nr:hypothetical protein L9F63_016997 [Diploptera punctata]
MNSFSRVCRNFQKNVILHQQCNHYSTHKNTSSTEYCLDLVRQYDYENFLCTLLLPSESRASAFAVRAFNIEIARVQDQVSDPRLGQMRMKFWEESVEKIFANDAPKHPVALELHRASKKHKLSKRYLKRLITSRADQLASSSFPNLEALEMYAENSVSSVYYLLLEASGVENIHADHVASHLGKAHGITNIIRSVPHNAPRQIISLPQDILLQHNVAHEAIFRARVTKEFKDVVFDVASRAKTHLDKARSLSKNIPKSASLLFLPAITIDSYLERLRLLDFDVFSGSLQRRNNTLPFVLLWNKLLTKY